MIATIGYERSTLADFVQTLEISGIDLLVDIRERAQSRRAGFSKSALASALGEVGISYIHLRELGDPKEGRDAARSGRLDIFREVYREVMSTASAKAALDKIAELSNSHSLCLMCYERDVRECHRKIVADHLENVLGKKATHLGVQNGIAIKSKARRMLHINQSASAQVQ